MTTPILFPGPFYLPVILPPEKFFTIPDLYYKKLKEDQGVTVSVTIPDPLAPLEIHVGKPDEIQEREDEDVPVSVVHAATAGFVTYENQDVVLSVWPGHFKNLVKPPNGHRPNRIVYGSLDPDTVEVAMQMQIDKLPLAVLQESWVEEHGGGVPPGDPATLQAAMLTRFLGGTAAIYVDAGAHLGKGTIVDDEAVLTLQTFFAPAGPLLPVSIPVPAEELIDNAREIGRLRLYSGHPLVDALNDIEFHVDFVSRFFIWNNQTFTYQPLALTPVALQITPPIPLVPADLIPSIPIAVAVTDVTGRILLGADLPSRAVINFRYKTAGNVYGNRLYPTDVETDPHKARLHVDPDSVNRHAYKAKYEIFPDYMEFINDIAARGKFETLEADRGNASEFDQSTPDDLLTLGLEAAAAFLPDALEPRIAFSQRELQHQIAAFESFHKLDVMPPKALTFNILVEGDSWTNYPLAYNDLYSQLDRIIQKNLAPGVAYNRIPLQHFGDRGAQMFETVAGTKRQWDFTSDFLREYQIDLILCSAGGNDFAEPGMSSDFDIEPYVRFQTGGYFDPFLAHSELTQSEHDQALELMKRSFAAMLRNHRWSLYVRNQTQASQLSAATIRTDLDAKLALIGNGDFGYTPEEVAEIYAAANALSAMNPPSISSFPPFVVQALADAVEFSLRDAATNNVLQTIGDKVIANYPDEPLPNSVADQLLDYVFDRTAAKDGHFDERYATLEQHWRILLDAAKPLGIPVISHTYGYPLFSEEPASLLGYGINGLTGPWFAHRFREANITDQRVQKICLKAFLDTFVNTVFRKLKPLYPLFDYVDSRNLNSDVRIWRDELHLRATGYKTLAQQVFNSIQQWPNVARYFGS